MQENIDVRMANYLTILSNKDLASKFYGNDVRAMEDALALYVKLTARSYVESVRQSQERQQTKEEIKKAFLD